MTRQAPDCSRTQDRRTGDVPIQWRAYRFDQLENDELYAVLAARVAVFVVEQDCPYQDLDGLDDVGLHLVGWLADWLPERRVAAYARILPPGTRFAQPSIGRVLTDGSLRRTGLGRELMRRAISATREHHPGHAIRLSAQCYLDRFYAELGFSVDSAPYEEDGIPHVEMELPANAAGGSTRTG